MLGTVIAASVATAVGIGILIAVIRLHCKKCNKKQIKKWQKDGTIDSVVKCAKKNGKHITLETLNGKKKYEVEADKNNYFGKIKIGEIYNWI